MINIKEYKNKKGKVDWRKVCNKEKSLFKLLSKKRSRKYVELLDKYVELECLINQETGVCLPFSDPKGNTHCLIYDKSLRLIKEGINGR